METKDAEWDEEGQAVGRARMDSGEQETEGNKGQIKDGQCGEQGCIVQGEKRSSGKSTLGQWNEQRNECNEQLRKAFSEIVKGERET